MEKDLGNDVAANGGENDGECLLFVLRRRGGSLGPKRLRAGIWRNALVKQEKN